MQFIESYLHKSKSLWLCAALLFSPTIFADIEVDADGGASLEINGFSTNSTALKVGIDYSDSSLIVTNDGSITVNTVAIGSAASDRNSVLVTGSNSYIQAESSMTVGSDNTLDIDDGGWIFVGGLSTNIPASGGIRVGNTNGTASLSIASGTKATGANLLVGVQANETGTVTLSGAGAELTLAENLLLGTAGSNNTVTVENGAALNIGDALQVGSTNGGNNHLYINSGGSVSVSGSTTITDGSTNSITVGSGGHLSLSEGLDLDDSTNGFNITNGASLQLGGTLQAGSLDSNIAITLDGTNASWTTAGQMYIGNQTNGNTLTVQDGAAITTSVGKNLYLGNASDDNELLITGTNSQLIAHSSAFVGNAGSDNTLTVEENGTATITGPLVIGNASGATGNQVDVRSGGHLTAQTNVIVGLKGIGNQLNIEDGGTLTAQQDFIIGREAEATGVSYDKTGNIATVGEDAALNIHENLIVGKAGGGSILLIRDGGMVTVSNDVVIGETVGDNYIFLEADDPDSRFNVTGDLIVSKDGGDNRFAVYGGTADIVGNLYLGGSTNQHTKKNYIHLETTNAVLNVANAIHVGASNSLNTLDVVLGAEANTHDLFVGTYDGVSNNVVTVRGENNYDEYVSGSLLSVSNTLAIGSTTGSNNTVNVDRGGTLFVGGDINIAASTNDLNNRLNINDGGTLQIIDWDFATTSTNIILNSGATLEVAGLLSGTNWVESGMGFTLNGTNALWDAATNALYVGHETNDNLLTITNGATASTATNLYIGYASENNTITVGGTGSELNVGNDLFIGTEDDASKYNDLSVLDGAQVSIGRDAYLYRGATLKIDSKSQVAVAGDYEQDQYSTLSIGISSNAAPPNLNVVGNAELAKGSTIEVYDDGIGDDTNVVQNIVKAGTLTIGGQTASTGLLFDDITIETNLLLNFTTTVSNGTDSTYIVLDNFIKRSIKEAAGLEGMLADVADEIEDMAKGDDELAIEMVKIMTGLTEDEANKAMNDYYGEKESSAPMHNVVNQGIGGIAAELTVRGDNTRARTDDSAPAPVGAEGPHMQGQELQGWIAGYGSWGSRSASDGYNAYDANLSGFIIGADLAASQNILVGLAGGSNRGSVDKDNGGSGDTKTTFGAVYASAGTQDWFFDGSIIYGGSEIDQTLGAVFDTTASYDAQNLAFYFGGGKEITGDYLIITPQASLLANYYKQDAYDEESNNAVGRSVDSFDALYVQSSLGCSLGFYTTMGNTTLKPELRAHWLHEFNTNEESLSYRLIGGNGSPYAMSLQAPVEDIILLGAGMAAKMSDYLELRVDLDTQQASSYSDFTLLGSLRYQF